MGGDKGSVGGDSRVFRDNFPRPTIKGKIRYQDDNIGQKQSLLSIFRYYFAYFPIKEVIIKL